MNKNCKGLTLMEIVIVLAVIAILGAIIIPNFSGYTDRARLRSDIQNARVIQSAIDLYKVEAGKDAWENCTNVTELIAYLVNADYLTGVPSIQTADAVWNYDDKLKRIFIDISKSSESVKGVRLSEAEKAFVVITN